MKKYLLMLLLLALILTGCADQSAVPEAGNLTFDLPEGYSVADKTDMNCSIVRDEDRAEVGGIILTQLTEKNMSEQMLLHLDSVTGTGVINEYFSWKAESKGTPIMLVSHYMTDPDTMVREEFHRIVFVKEGSVYDMWFDTKLIGVDEIEEIFYPLFDPK